LESEDKGPAAGPPDVSKEVDFDIVREDWTRYRLEDGTILRVRIALVKLVPTGMSELGTPDIGVLSQNILSTVVPKELLKRGGQTKPGRISAQDIKEGKDLGFELMGLPQWQEYKTRDGWLVMVKPEIGRVVRLSYYNDVGEPVYWAGNIQPVFRVKKAP